MSNRVHRSGVRPGVGRVQYPNWLHMEMMWSLLWSHILVLFVLVAQTITFIVRQELLRFVIRSPELRRASVASRLQLKCSAPSPSSNLILFANTITQHVIPLLQSWGVPPSLPRFFPPSLNAVVPVVQAYGLVTVQWVFRVDVGSGLALNPYWS